MSRAGCWRPPHRCHPAPIASRRRSSRAAATSSPSAAARRVQPLVVLKLLVLLALANGMPVVAKKVFGRRVTHPLDGDAEFVDGRPLFGRSKTIRGVVLAVLAATLGAPLVGLEWRI